MKKQFRKIYIEITNVCNLNCSFCPKTKRKPEFMSLDLFKTAIKESKHLCEEITLHVMGEPLIHPEIKEIIEFAQKENVKINLTTNGTLVSKHQNILLSKAIRRINFSIHGIKNCFSKEEQQVHLKNIISFTKRAQKEREDLIITYRLWNINDESNSDIIKTIEKKFNIELEEKSNKISTKIVNNAFIHYDNSFEWPDPNKKIKATKGYCHGLSNHIGILSDGTVIPCCLDNNGNIPLGNIKNNTINEILKSPRAINMKKGFQERKLKENLCKGCTYIKRFEKNKDRQ
jgi:radical SAM protein with 4Fe4S-binding SPASM domain